MGPLKGVKVVEMAGIGPGPFSAMMLADMGAEVIRVDRKTPARGRDAAIFKQDRADVINRGRRSVAVDLKAKGATEAVLKLVAKADVLIEGFRPGVMERLGLGPDVCLARNPKLVYGRITGWGQDGPLSNVVGHDINYISISGALGSFGPSDAPPVPPANLVGDFGGGLGHAYGIVCALLEARTSGKGQVVDTAMCEVSGILAAYLFGLKAKGRWDAGRGKNMLDGGAHFYGSFECSDGKYISVAAIETQFYAALMELTGLKNDPEFANQLDQGQWPKLRKKIAAFIKTKPRDHWCKLLEGTDACVAPVLDLDEAPKHPHNRARETYAKLDDVMQPTPAPRFSRTKPKLDLPPPFVGEHTDAVLKEWGFSSADIDTLKASGTI